MRVGGGEFWRDMEVVSRSERLGCVGGSEMGALLRVDGAHKTKVRSGRRSKETVVKKSPGLGAHECATGEIGWGLS